ncbi:hypothetical protein tb265_14240 [Gemmatimonadetes bacterium T265]|nr:hypothetical protein tb265_14240 [Gemmatimonadetes bacterium T265]
MFSYAAAAAEWLRRSDRHRNIILALILIKVTIEGALGVPTSRAAILTLAIWLAAGVTLGWMMERVHDADRRVRYRTLIILGDITGVAVTQYLVGGTVWLGTSAYAFLLVVSAVALPGRRLAALTAWCAVAYGIPLFAETFGILRPYPLSGSTPPTPTLAQAVTVWGFMALMLAGVAALLHAFIRLVRQAGEWHQTLVEQAPVMIGTVDRSGRITAANPAAAAGFGVSPGTLVGRTFHDFIAPESEQTRESSFAMVLAGRARQFETRMRRADGVERWVDVVAHPLGAGGDVRDVLCLIRDVTEARATAEALARQAYHDALTGLANRVRFAQRLGEALARAARVGDPERVAVLVLDLDGFKTVNDSLGHAAGDALLVEVAARLLDATRGSDTVARLGGDEFAVLLERVGDDADAIRVAERVLAALRPAFTIEARRAFVGTSIGIARGGALVDGMGEAAVDTLLRNADAAMYRAKASGKGRWAVFEPDMHEAALSRLALAADLRQALEREELCLAFQPIVALDTGRAVGVEALVRWRHPERGLVPPGEFIPFAEETGLIVPLGRWVMGEACRQAAAWRAAGFAAPHGGSLAIAVNVSGQQIEHPGFVAEVLDVLRETGLPPGALTVEITEYSVVARPDVMRARLTELRDHGVQIAIDDFGTGYSALGHLQQFPLDVLKIDRAFVDRVTRGGPPAAVTRTLIALGEALALRTVAEGIETEAQRAHLAGIGCVYGQGYLFARPLDPGALAAWLAEHGARTAAEPVALAAA